MRAEDDLRPVGSDEAEVNRGCLHILIPTSPQDRAYYAASTALSPRSLAQLYPQFYAASCFDPSRLLHDAPSCQILPFDRYAFLTPKCMRTAGANTHMVLSISIR
ncbi:hypothetical protein PsYK624_048450 [Phanerochaete sordida]|uniref:Uncharacterized protein n=1 Tax=Phanerochaete sordida TaxID=48140 RepID=A0A9P3G6K3_9APHY|nr:hypothetical protein PsYK624_048450 [Phanerochaete sordida]